MLVGFVGSRKCIIPMVKELIATDWDFQFNIAGRGNLESELHDIIDKDARFNCLGEQQPEQIHSLLNIPTA